MELIIYLIAIPFIAGLLCLMMFERLTRLSGVIAIVTSVICLVISIFVYQLSIINSKLFLIDGLNRFIVPAIALFGFLIILYSLKFLPNIRTLEHQNYYCYILWTLSASFGAVLSNHLVLLLVFWGFLGITLYLLIQISLGQLSNWQTGKLENLTGEEHNNRTSEQSTAAKKTFIIIGGSDCLMLLGIAIIWFLTGTFQMDKINIQLNQLTSSPGSWLGMVAFFCLVIAAFAKAGAMPVHTWIPDMAVTSPVPVTAFLPASLDKLLGIYLLARICINLFCFNFQLSILNYFLMSIGAVTIIAAVFMAMVQHDMNKLLSYHAVSQVGYMVLGIGTGNPIGIAGGIFHMLNNAIYKSCLFLCGGSVEYKTRTSDLDKLGGLSRYMPVTFITCLIAVLSISGVPPFNGFVSKWMVYQGVIQLVVSVPRSEPHGWMETLYGLFFIVAMFGSALTLASFMKFIHSIFLGQNADSGTGQLENRITEVPWQMLIPQIILAILCIIFGIFAFELPLKHFIFPIVVQQYSASLNELTHLWGVNLPTAMVVIGLITGAIIYFIPKIKVRTAKVYLLGKLNPQESKLSGTDFYNTIKDISIFNLIYFLVEKKLFDIYHWGKKIVISLSSLVSLAHTGNLHFYLIWCVVGMIILLLCLVG